jgi:BMFP domain-containing protein YqiC
MSALDDCLDMHKTKDYSEWIKLYQEAREELASLRQRVAELDEARNTAGVIDGVSLVDWLREELSLSADCRHRVAELEAAQAIVAPNNCRHCQRAAEKMRDRAAVCVAGMWRLKDQFGEYHMINLQPVSDTIMTLPLKSCDGCNPLKPE